MISPRKKASAPYRQLKKRAAEVVHLLLKTVYAAPAKMSRNSVLAFFEGGGRLSLLKRVAKRGIMNTKSGLSVLTAKRRQQDVLK